MRTETATSRGHAVLAALVSVLALVGCGGPSAAQQHPSNSPTPPPQPPLLVLLEAPFGAVPNALDIVGGDGTQRARVALPPTAEAVAVAGTDVLVAGGGTMEAVDEQGRVRSLGPIPYDAPAQLVRGLVGSPDGSRWLWSAVEQNAVTGQVHSRVIVGGPGLAPRVLVERDEPGRALEPVAWTGGGAVVADEPLGIGGYVLFRRTFGSTDRLDTSTGTLTPLTGDDCAFSDLAADGTVACISDGREGPHGDAPVALHVLRPGAAGAELVDAPLAAPVAQAGAALFAPGGGRLSLALSPSLGTPGEQVSTEVVDLPGGARHPVGPPGVMPEAWLPDGRLVAARLPGVTGGDPGTYVVAADGTAARISALTGFVGVMRPAAG